MEIKFQTVIEIVFKKLLSERIKCCLVGSSNLKIQGIDLSPRDLDIVVQKEDLRRIREIFSRYKPSEIKKLPPMTDEPGWDIKMEINGIEVQILGEEKTGEYVSKLLDNKIIKILVGETEVPCFTLEAEAQAYAETNRQHKTDLIKEFLRQNEEQESP